MAPRTRSRASVTAASGRPTMVNPGNPGATSASTRISRPSSPCRVAEATTASMAARYRAGLTPGLSRTRRRLVAGADSAGAGRRRDRGRLVDRAGEVEQAAAERRVGLREHERRPGVQRADRAAVLVHDLVVDRALQRALGVLDVDAGERVRAVE